ncbi:hypothetical protein TNCV_1226051, partial [Trichonephila clavipes]
LALPYRLFPPPKGANVEAISTPLETFGKVKLTPLAKCMAQNGTPQFEKRWSDL